MMMKKSFLAAVVVVAVLALTLSVRPAGAQGTQAPPPAAVQPPAMPAGSTPVAPAGVGVPTPAAPVAPPADYVIGQDDILTVKVWQDDRMSADVVVRPDGMVTLALINDIRAAGLTPEQFRASVVAAAGKFVQGPTVDVVVKQINSRKIFLTGEVAKPGAYPLSSRMTVMQAIALAGGLTEYANKGRVTILRTEGDKTVVLRVHYGNILDGRNLQQNYDLKPGDVVTVSD